VTLGRWSMGITRNVKKAEMVNDRTRRSVALVTYDARPEPTDDDRLLADALAARGCSVHAVPWSRPTHWRAFDAVVVRSPWDYFHRSREFHGWLDDLQADGVPVHNDVRILRWNADKSYLRELESRGIAVIPTRWLDAGSAVTLGALRRESGWEELVVKPTVSGGAHRTWRASPDAETTDELRLAEMLEDGAVMVQPLVAEVERDGEWSLVFFDGTFSHAILKRPRSGDFRVQREHGGTIETAGPAPSVIAAAKRALAAIPFRGAPPLYARVDGCIVDGALRLMELEVLEPELFLRCAPESAERLAESLLARMD
jgi:glutathione synthase/RimK-type ligase-like ATP-grasp enzyme